MAIRKIVFLPDPCLRKPTKNIEKFDQELHHLIDDMFDTMYEADGVGLAAPQIGLSLNLAVMDVSNDKTQQLVLANPEIIFVDDFVEKMQEGCLSVPGTYDIVTRATRVKFRAQDKFGKPYEMEARGLFAECVQHELDHLRGKLFIDLLSPLKRQRAIHKCEKYKRAKAR